MRIGFLWEGYRLHYGKRFQDGLYLALQHLKKRHVVRGFEPNEEAMIHGFRPDVILYWGALCEKFKPLVASYPYKKAICYAGGPIVEDNVHGFDLYFVESEVNEKDFTAFGKPWMRAFGVNEEIFKPSNAPKKYDAAYWGTHALWKGNDLFAEAVGPKGISIGQFQEHEKECYLIPMELGCEVYPEMPREKLVEYINQSHTALNCSNVWGGGQRMTLEAMACNIPPIVMNGSPKNMEYVQESGVGLIVDPDIDQIREAIEKLKGQECKGRDYIMSKWSSHHYADALEKGLKQIYEN